MAAGRRVWGVRLALLSALLLSACAQLTPSASSTLDGAQWTALASGSDASLRGLCVVDDEVLWASGSGGTLLRSLDAGESWQRIPVPGAEAMDFRDLHAFDAQTVLLMGITKPACILRTQDGGQTWETVLESPLEAEFFDSMAFFDRRRGCVFGDPQDGVFRIFVTEDGGASWQAIPEGAAPHAFPGEAAFAASGTCIDALPTGEAWIGTGGERARVLRSTDFGKSWSAQVTPMVAGGTHGIYSVAFQNPAEGIVVGGSYAEPEQAANNLALSVDGGLSWQGLRTGQGLGGYRSAVAYVPGHPRALVATGKGGSDYSTDGGRTWQPLLGEGYYALGFTPSGVGFGVGAQGRIGRLEPQP